MSFEPHLPVWLLGLLALGLLGLAILTYRRPSVPALLRLAGVTLLVLMLAGPTVYHQQNASEAAPLALVLDTSASMAAEDRLPKARAALEQLAKELGPQYRLRLQALDSALHGAWPEAATGAATDFGPLAELGRNAAPAAIILASDGVDRGQQAPDAELASAGVPVFAIAVGSTDPASNASCSLDASGPTAFPGQDIVLNLHLRATGAAVGSQAEVVVTDDDQQEILRQTVTLSADQRLPVHARLPQTAGERLWTAKLAPIPGEVTTADNSSSCTVQVVDRQLRLIVVEGQPYWDTSFAVRAWRRDSQLAVQSVYRLGREQYRAGTEGEAMNIDAAGLQELDLIVLGQAVEQVLDEAQQQLIVDFVDAGGGVLFLGRHVGFEGPLASIDPLIRRRGSHEKVAVELTPAGELAALLPPAQRLPPVAAGAVSDLRPRTELLLGSPEVPLVVRRRSGAGQVAAVNAEGIWRWSLDRELDQEIAARFWRQLVKSLVRRQTPALAADRLRYRQDQEAVLAFAEPTEPVLVEPPEGEPRQLVVSDRQARLRFDQPGIWTIRQGEARLRLPVAADVREITAIGRDDARLGRLAAATGGAVIAADAVSQLAERLRRRADLQVSLPLPDPLVVSPWWLLLLAALLGSEWYLRRRRFGAI